VVKVRVSNAGRLLQPGMFARGTVVTGSRPEVLQIPEQAVMTTAAGSIVFVVDGGRAGRRSVTLGERRQGSVEVKSGVRAGERVVVEGQEGLTDNQAVAPRALQR
jgi:membrane fusion protein (multidrug efflux system)